MFKTAYKNLLIKCSNRKCNVSNWCFSPLPMTRIRNNKIHISNIVGCSAAVQLPKKCLVPSNTKKPSPKHFTHGNKKL